MDEESCLTVGIEKGFLRIGKIKIHSETKNELEIQADVYQLIILRKVLLHISDQPITISLSDSSRWIGINGIVI